MQRPELWRWSREFNAHSDESRVWNSHIRDQPFALIPVLLIQQQQLLPERYFCPERQQYTVGARAQCKSLFAKGLLPIGASLHNQWYVEGNSLAASVCDSGWHSHLTTGLTRI